MNKKELIKELRKQVDIVQRVISDWRSLHGELNDVLLFFEKIGFDEGRKIILKISDVESRLVEEAVEEFTPVSYTHLTLPTTPYV